VMRCSAGCRLPVAGGARRCTARLGPQVVRL
jgi:hypothetical protein